MKLINTHKIANQEELLSKLEADGFPCTQTTLSRDLKLLEVGRKSDKEKGYVYILPEITKSEPAVGIQGTYPINGFVSFDFSNHLGVIKTLPGYASSIAIIIDNRSPFGIIGTIAGDDTILVIPRDGVSRTDLVQSLVLVFPDLEGKI